MKTFKFLSLILVALIAMGASCNRPPKPEPTQQGFTGEIATQPITVDGVETGYTLSYRSWIIPGSDMDGNKAQSSPKSVYNDNSSAGRELNANSSNSFERRSPASETKSLSYGAKGGSSTQNDTVSVILHDKFYHVDTIGYVSDWNPDKYKQGSYTCHWDRYGLPRPGESNVTIIDSTAILRVQFAEFSFNYCLNFEVANYNDGVINIQMPYHAPVVTDLGVEELESMETICRNDSVFARRVLKHSIKVVVGSKTYILNAKVLLYRYMPFADPSRFVVKSEVIGDITSTYYPLDSLDLSKGYYKYYINLKNWWSDGTEENVTEVSNVYVGVHKAFDHTNAPYVPCEELQSYQYSHMTQDDTYCYFHYTGTNYPVMLFLDSRGQLEWVYDDGYTDIWTSFHAEAEYSSTMTDCVLRTIFTYVKITVDDNPPQVVRISRAFAQ